MSARILPAALAISALLCGAAAVASGQTSYYRSNEIGIPFEQISETQAADHRFVLVHLPATEADDETSDERFLLESGYQVHRWVKRRDAGGRLLCESEYANGELVAERSFDATGKLTEEVTYEAGDLVSRTSYAYEPRLVQVEATGSDNAVRFRATYRLAATGHLRDFVYVAPGEGQSGVRFLFAGGALVEEVVTTGATRLVSRYLAGDRYEVEEWLGGTLHTLRQLERSPGGSLVAEYVTEPARDRRTTTHFDAAGRVLEVLVTERGSQIELVRHHRDEAGRIVSTRRENAIGDERLEYDYVVSVQAALNDGPDDRLQSLRHEQNDELVSIETYTWPAADEEPLARQLDYYHDGALHLRVLFRGDTRTREQVLRDGQVIRERVFDGGKGR